ncbi:TetR family transcriptional regulator [Streptomyces huasconensis]|uniref:hypothetical protein n=1 Tax=Streptomyces huasconensis TaxID=1854574 RepID=UPI0036FFABD9
MRSSDPDVKAPALYWHFKDKQALLDEMATEMMRRMAEDFPAAPAADWREVVTGAMRALRGHLLRTLVEAGFTPGPERGYDLAARAERLAAVVAGVGATLVTAGE